MFLSFQMKKIRDYFEKKLSTRPDIVIPLNNYELSCTRWLCDLQKNNLLLLNIIDNEKRLEKEFQDSNSIFAKSAFYYCLVLPIEKIIETRHGLVMVCDENLILKILNSNTSVSSCSNITFIDDVLKEEKVKIFKK